MPRTNITAACRCGRATIEVVGAPILSAVCCCESCRTAGRQLELAGVAPIVRPDGGTDYCLYRKDRVRIASGAEHLEERRLRPASPTRRVVATCCHTSMFLDFTRGHWLNLYRDRLAGDAPRLEMRVMAKDAPAGSEFADEVPTYRAYPPIFMIKLLLASAAMGFRRPKIAW